MSLERRFHRPLEIDKTAVEKILRSGRSLQRRIILFSIFIVTATSILVVALISSERKAVLEKTQFNLTNLSAAFEEHVRQAFNAVSDAIDRIKSDMPYYGPDGAIRRAEYTSPPATFTVTGVGGKVMASNVDQAARVQDISDLEHFRVHVGNRHRGLFIGRPIVGRPLGQIFVPLSSRIERADGKFEGVVVASVRPNFISSLYRSVDLGETGSLMLIGTDRVVRAYFRGGSGDKDANEAMYVGTVTSPEAKAVGESQFDADGAYEETGQVDGVLRIFHWRKVRGYPLIVIVGMGKSETLHSADRRVAMVLGVGGTALVLALFMPFILYREISRRIANEIGLNLEKVKLKQANDALAEERKNLCLMNHELAAQKLRLEKASNAKSIFLTNISHEFRTPMHAILNYTNMSLKRIAVEDCEKIQKYMENARAAGLRLLGLLNGLLDLAKLEDGRIEFHPVKADLLACIRATQEELGSLLEEKGIRVVIDVRTECTSALFDPKRITQVVVNLFSNAIKFSPRGGLIRVQLSNAALKGGVPGLQCSILDEGTGIPEGELVKIFDRFSQSSVTIRSGGGSGLGLTICRELIDLHGGIIRATNQEDGGACFTFILPKDACATAHAKAPQTAGSGFVLSSTAARFKAAERSSEPFGDGER